MSEFAPPSNFASQNAPMSKAERMQQLQAQNAQRLQQFAPQPGIAAALSSRTAYPRLSCRFSVQPTARLALQQRSGCTTQLRVYRPARITLQQWPRCATQLRVQQPAWWFERFQRSCSSVGVQ